MQYDVIDALWAYINTFSKQDVGSLVSAVANVVMAIGVVFAAKSLRVQKTVLLIDLHNRFQREIRCLQEKMPADINSGRLTYTPDEKRVVRLYWYAVVDEWLTCKVKSKDQEINRLWHSFAWGAKSAIEHLPIFASEFIALKKGRPYLLGTHGLFFDEIESFCLTHEPNSDHIVVKTRQHCVFLFGGPCSGKSSVADVLESAHWDTIKIDPIVSRLAGGCPTKESFTKFSDEVCLAIYSHFIDSKSRKPTVVELGCLFPRESAEHLLEMLKLLAVDVISVRLNIPIPLAQKRALDRNALIASRLSDALPIDDVGAMSQFFSALENNAPVDAMILDAEVNDAQSLAHSIIATVRG